MTSSVETALAEIEHAWTRLTTGAASLRRAVESKPRASTEQYDARLREIDIEGTAA